MGLLALIKKLVHTGGANDVHTRPNKTTSHRNLMNLNQELFQDSQDFRDLYMAVRKVCYELELRFVRCKSDTKAIFKE